MITADAPQNKRILISVGMGHLHSTKTSSRRSRLRRAASYFVAQFDAIWCNSALVQQAVSGRGTPRSHALSQRTWDSWQASWLPRRMVHVKTRFAKTAASAFSSNVQFARRTPSYLAAHIFITTAQCVRASSNAARLHVTHDDSSPAFPLKASS